MAFRVPYGVDKDNQLVAANATQMGDRSLTCPGCGGPLAVKGGSGKKVQRHLSHRGDVESCSEESMLHKLAIRMIVDAITGWKNGGRPILVNRRCSTCAVAFSRPLPARITSAVPEYTLPSGRRADVALLNAAGKPVAVVEVHHTHAVDKQKADDLTADGVSCAELVAVSVVDDPNTWDPTEHLAEDRLCDVCWEREKQWKSAKLPSWVTMLEHIANNTEMLRHGTKLHLCQRDTTGEFSASDFDVRVATLARVPKSWPEAFAQAQQEANRQARLLGLLPESARLFWLVDAVVRAFDGRWEPGLDAPHWCTRERSKEPDDKRRATWKQTLAISAETGQSTRVKDYWAMPYRCTSPLCRSEMLVYEWKGKRYRDFRSPVPRPRTIQRRYNPTADLTHWINVCPTCDHIQDDDEVGGLNGPVTNIRKWTDVF